MHRSSCACASLEIRCASVPFKPKRQLPPLPSSAQPEATRKASHGLGQGPGRGRELPGERAAARDDQRWLSRCCICICITPHALDRGQRHGQRPEPAPAAAVTGTNAGGGGDVHGGGKGMCVGACVFRMAHQMLLAHTNGDTPRTTTLRCVGAYCNPPTTHHPPPPSPRNSNSV